MSNGPFVLFVDCVVDPLVSILDRFTPPLPYLVFPDRTLAASDCTTWCLGPGGAAAVAIRAGCWQCQYTWPGPQMHTVALSGAPDQTGQASA